MIGWGGHWSGGSGGSCGSGDPGDPGDPGGPGGYWREEQTDGGGRKVENRAVFW